MPKPVSEWIVNNDESQIIISHELWEKVQQRRHAVKKIWLGGNGEREFSRNQGSCQSHYPTHLLVGAIVCASCGSTISQASGKGGGYYG